MVIGNRWRPCFASETRSGAGISWLVLQVSSTFMPRKAFAVSFGLLLCCPSCRQTLQVEREVVYSRDTPRLIAPQDSGYPVATEVLIQTYGNGGDADFWVLQIAFWFWEGKRAGITQAVLNFITNETSDLWKLDHYPSQTVILASAWEEVVLQPLKHPIL